MFLVMANAPHKNKRYPIYLWEWRKAKGLTGPELAERTGFDQGTISAIEIGSRRAHLDHLIAIAEGLGLSTAQLFHAPGDPMSDVERVIATLPEDRKAQAAKVLSAFLEPPTGS